MQNFLNNSYKPVQTVFFTALFAAVALMTTPVNVAHADFYDSSCCSTGWTMTSGDSSYAPNTGWTMTSGDSSYAPSTGWTMTSGNSSYTPSTGWTMTSGDSSYAPSTISSAPATTYATTYQPAYTGGVVSGGYSYPYYSYSSSYPYYGSGYYGGSGAVTSGGVSFSPSPYTYTSATFPTVNGSNSTITSGGVNFTPNGYNSSYYQSGTYAGSGAPTCNLTAYQNYINPGGSTVLSWSSQNSSYGYIAGVGTVQAVGTSAVAPSQTTGYTATFYGPGGQVNCYTTVVVNGTGAAPMNGISLSQVPYTGLDLGPVGTIVYWLVLLVVCALIAYLIVVKRVQDSLLMNLRIVFLGHPSKASHPVYKKQNPASGMKNTEKIVTSTPAPTSPTATVGSVDLPTSQTSSEDKTDDFIMSQINK